MNSVLQKLHKETFGKDVTVTQDTPLVKYCSSKSEPKLQVVQVSIPSDIAEVLRNEVTNLEKLLKDLHIKVDINVNGNQGTIVITPSKGTPAGWMKCEAIVKGYITNNFDSKDINASKEAVVDIIKLLQTKHKKEITYHISEDSTTLHLVGHPNLLSQIQTPVNEIIANYTNTEKQIPLSPEDYDFVLQVKHKEISQVCPNVKTIFIHPYTLCLSGVAKDVKKLEESIVKLSVHSSVALVLEPLVVDYLCTKVGHEQLRKYANTFFKQISVAICIKKSVSDSTVMILCDQQSVDIVSRMVPDLQKALCVEQFKLSPKCQSKLSETDISKDYSELTNELQQKNFVIVNNMKDSVCIVGFQGDVTQAISLVKKFIQSKCRIQNSVSIESGVWRLFQTYMNCDWNELLASAKDIKINHSAGKSVTVTFCGQIDAVDEICIAVSRIQKSVFKKDVHPPVQIVGFHIHQKSKIWENFLHATEFTRNVCIEVLQSEEVKGAVQNSNESWADSHLSQPIPIRIDASKLRCVKIHKGSLLDVKADAYVNSTNTQLDLSGGVVSKLISTAAGPALQEECTRKGPIAPGQVVVTGGGKIKCKYIFHIAVESYDGPGGSAEKAFKESIFNCFEECKKRKISSIAFPAIGTGALNFPPHITAQIMMKSVTAVKELPDIVIHFVIFMDDVHKAFEETKKMLEESTSVSQPTENQIQSIFSAKGLKSLRQVFQSIKTPSDSGEFNINGVTVNVVQGDITDQKTDVIVNSTGPQMNSTSGVSGAILKKGGSELKKACDAYIASNKELDIGQIATTPAKGSLKCKDIFHINAGPADIDFAVTACLLKADGLKYQSISFPALATGSHKSSADHAASAMLKGIQKYAEKRPQHTTLIVIVIFLPEQYATFLKTFSLQSTLSSSTEISDALSLSTEMSDALSSSTEMSDALSETMHSVSSCDTPTNTYLCFQVFGKNEMDVKRAAGLLEDHLKEFFICETISDISKTPSADMVKTCNKNGVIFVHDTSLNTLTLTGSKESVITVRRNIETQINNLEKEGIKRETELLYKQVQWQYKSLDKSWVPYSAELNCLIENAYKNKKGKYEHNDLSDAFDIDFSTYIETKTSPSSGSVSVRREDLLARYHEDKPTTWEKMPIDQSTNKEVMYKLFPMSKTSPEYTTVLKMFSLTVTAKQIVNIQRVQNTVLYRQYVARRKVMEEINKTGMQNERQLFHGTKGDVCDKINSQGFNRSFAGANATMYGKGVYFAVDASYSAHQTYSPHDAAGVKRMYLARVLTGEYTVGNSAMIVPPAKNPLINPNILYDSVVDNITKPTMYIVFEDARAYPEYLLEFIL